MAHALPWARSPYWVIDPPEDYSKFFAELPSMRFPSGCFALLEGTSLADSVLMLLQPFLIEHKPGRRLLFLRSSDSRRYRVPLDPNIFSGLSTISRSLAGPEICNELLVFCGEDCVLSWYDFPSDPFYVSCSIPEDSVRLFCGVLGSSMKKESAAG
jgi:hypothetical protein